MDHELLNNTVAYLGAAIIAVPLFRKLGLGAILGYLVAGAIIGPQGLSLIAHPEEALHLAEFGVVMLLFIIGLELNPEKLWAMRNQITLLGGGQLVLCALLIAVLAFLFTDVSLSIALLIGLTLGLSSTAFAVQLMDEQGVMASHLGRKGFSILLLQDMAVIPILLFVAALAPAVASDSGDHVAWWQGVLAVVVVLVAGKYLLNPLLKVVAQSGSREVLTAAALFIVIGTASLMISVGLTMGMGAFLAGIVLANSSYRHQLEADIEPFKGLLLGLFFIAVGMTLNLQLLIEHPMLIIALALLLMLTKAIVIASLVRVSKSTWYESILLGLMLAQGGEFAFVVMAKALGLNLISAELTNYIVLVVGVSMALTSPLVMLLKYIEPKNETETREYDDKVNEEPEVIIAGFGRFGQVVGRILAANGVKFTALDKDASHVDFVKQFGNKIFYGDAKRQELLEAAGIDHATVIVVAVDDIEESMAVVELVRKERPNLPIIARARNRRHVYRLIEAGANEIIRETFESGLVAAKDTLLSIGFTEGQALRKVELFRQHDEKLIERAAEHKDDMEKLKVLSFKGRAELEQLFQKDSE